PPYFNRAYFLNLGTKMGSYTGKVKEYKDTEFFGEIGRSIHKTEVSHHLLYLGGNLRKIDIAFEEENSSAYQINYASLRYHYEKKWTEQFKGDVDTTLLYSLDFSSQIPSVKILSSLSYNLFSSLWLDGILGFD